MNQNAPTILLAEDEPVTRMMEVDLLVNAGFSVIETGGSDAALAALAARAASICVLFTDVHMPGSMNGLDLAHHVRERWPWIRLLIVSGQARPRVEQLPHGSHFLAKPFDPENVVAHVQQLVSEALS